MPLNFVRARAFLQSGDIRGLFIEELGWERPAQTRLTIDDRGTRYELTGVASTKSGRADVWTCIAPDGTIPDHATRLRIDTRLSEESVEHVTVFATPDMAKQSWVWVRRATKYRPRAVRTHLYHTNQSGDALLQKLQGLFLSIEDERGKRVGNEWLEEAFDIEPVTKKFYTEFAKYRQTFSGHIMGIPDHKDRDWYASVMLNRLMFTWFIQKKGFLDQNPNYLRDKLAQVEKQLGPNKFQSFYHSFLLRLFHDGLGKPAGSRPDDCDQLIGTVPYLNGGIFDVHSLEDPIRYGNTIQISDNAFRDLFAFFDLYQWHLDDRPVTKGNEINPDVLGYIFEKYINQKEMGAYYTKEDITDYIAKYTIIPFIIDSTKKQCAAPFNILHPSSVWRELQINPNKYINNNIYHGVNLELPENIHLGKSVEKLTDLQLRKSWNQSAPPQYALPNELWREVLNRRLYYKNLHTLMLSGNISTVSDLIKYNINSRQFLQDIIERCEAPDLLWAIWKTISTISVLDPTGGSGAFLFAALNILDPLYEACLDRMEQFIASWQDYQLLSSEDYYVLFSALLKEIDNHTNRRYFILKSIILKNLYAVDIMDEAVEICKLRLFLKLAAQVEVNYQHANLGIEPLPDIDFNIRAGNSLIGYATLEHFERSLSREFDFSGVLDKVKKDAEHIADVFRKYRTAQNSATRAQLNETKKNLALLLESLNLILDYHLASHEGVSNHSSDQFNEWKEKNRPFHWFVQFYDVISLGGFNVIIGNPPYLEDYQVDYKIDEFRSSGTGAIHAICMERSIQLLSKSGNFSMIVPLALVSTQRMTIMQQMLHDRFTVFYANYSWRPGKLFDNVNRALTIVCCISADTCNTYTTKYQQWFSENRNTLFEFIEYANITDIIVKPWVPKLHNSIDVDIYKTLLNKESNLAKYIKPRGPLLYYRTSGGLYWKIFTNFEPMFTINGTRTKNKQQASLAFQTEDQVMIGISVLSSSLFWWWYVTTSNVRHLTPYNIFSFHFPKTIFEDRRLINQAEILMNDMQKKSKNLTRIQKTTGITITQSFSMRDSKDIIDKIDEILCEHFQLDLEKLDYISTFDLKLRSNVDEDE